jgi:8-oxo-dGTP pyrophosphatase MutT (NUDIX family)
MEQLSSETVFDSPFLDVAQKRFRRVDGSEVDRQVIEHPGSVGILAHDDEVVYLVRQPREAVGEDGLLEIPAGTLDVDGESALECARRELSEEVGLAAEHWAELHSIYASPGYLSERLTIFEATGLSASPGESDETEEIEVVRLPLAGLEAAIAEIEDAKTLVALLLLERRLRGAEQRVGGPR